MVKILMATYNGEKYLSGQIDSLLAQTVTDFSILIADDGSSDGTWDIISHYISKFPDKISAFRKRENSGGSKYNFLDLMAGDHADLIKANQIKSNYYMLCDQDDIWQPDKIEKTLAKMKELETKSGIDLPILIHTDLQVVDPDLKVISPSYKRAMNSNFNRTALHQVIIQNILTGCTAMYNQPLARLLIRKPKYCIMHDWWLLLVAAAFGKVSHINDATILYRQHDKNEIGAKDVRKFSYKMNRLIHGGQVRQAIFNTFLQAESFLDTYNDMLTPKQKDIIEKYCAIPLMGKLKRWHTIYNLKSYKNGFSRNIAYFIFV